MVADDALININLADAETLSHLPGIGRQLAERIIAYRELEKRFADVMELTAVSGISENMVRNFEEQITVGSIVSEALAEDSLDLEPIIDETSEQQEAATDDKPEAEEEEIVVEQAATEEPLSSEEASSIEEDKGVPDPEDTNVPVLLMESGEDELLTEVLEVEAEDLADVPVVPVEAETAVSDSGGTTVFTSPPISRRRGCLFTILAAVLGALLGIGATLGILALLNNGNLAFSQTDARIEAELAGAQAAQGDLETQVIQLERALSAMATRTGELAVEQIEANQQVATLEAEALSLTNELKTAQTELETTQVEVVALAETAQQLEAEIETVNVAAETFNTFLDRLRDLLVNLQGETTLEEAAPDAEPSTATATLEPTATLVITTTLTRVPTRTPRPTATPFATATAEEGG